MAVTIDSAAAPTRRRTVIVALAVAAVVSAYVAVQGLGAASTSTADGLTPVTVAWPMAADLMGLPAAVPALDWPAAADAGGLGVMPVPGQDSGWRAETSALGAAPPAADQAGR